MTARRPSPATSFDSVTAIPMRFRIGSASIRCQRFVRRMVAAASRRRVSRMPMCESSSRSVGKAGAAAGVPRPRHGRKPFHLHQPLVLCNRARATEQAPPLTP